jgi:hypothetical protein
MWPPLLTWPPPARSRKRWLPRTSAPVGPEEDRADGKVAGSSIRVHVAAMAAATCSFIAPQGGAITA